MTSRRSRKASKLRRTSYVESPSAGRQRTYKKKKSKGDIATTKNNTLHVGTYGENVRAWTGITIKNWSDIPWDCKCTWAMHNGQLELKFPWAICPYSEHSRVCLGVRF